MYYRVMQGLFLPHTQCSWDNLQFHHGSAQDKVVTQINKWIPTKYMVVCRATGLMGSTLHEKHSRWSSSEYLNQRKNKCISNTYKSIQTFCKCFLKAFTLKKNWCLKHTHIKVLVVFVNGIHTHTVYKLSFKPICGSSLNCWHKVVSRQLSKMSSYAATEFNSFV